MSRANSKISVFSAHAEVVPRKIFHRPRKFGILRARGGSSRGFWRLRGLGWYSPRTRR